MRNQLVGLVSALVVMGACGGSSGGMSAACNPLGGDACLMPWPSMAYLTVDSTTVTGYRVAIPREAMPINADGIVIEPTILDRWDGFSPTGPMLVTFPTGVSGTNLPPFSDPDQSLAADSPIVLLDVDTGERAPFFAELDMNQLDPTQRGLIIRPLARLHEQAHYAVAIRNTVTAADGSALPVSPAFEALRAGTAFDHPRFAAMQATAPEMFAALDTAGVAQGDLALAWDFRTASDDYLRSDLTSMRTQALPAIGTNAANLGFTATAQTGTTAYRTYLGTYKSPDFLTNAEANDSVLSRDSEGAPMMHGLRDARLAAIVPACVTSMPLPRPTIIFGHGLFGSAQSYLNEEFVQQLAEDYCIVIIAGDFIGLTERQLTAVSLAVNDLNLADTISEKLAQSIIDFMSLEQLARGPMATAPEFAYNGAPVIDTTKIFYVGGSLGGIMGNVLMAYDANLTRGVLAVPGGVWSMLTERSNAWSLLVNAAQGAYPKPSDYELLVAFLGMGLEPYDPITTAAHVIKDPLFGNPVKSILMWYSIGDCLVTNISTEMIARTMGIDVIGPSVKSPWHLTPNPDIASLTNGVTIFNDHPTPLPPDTNVPPTVDNGTHAGINRKPAALRAVQEFLINTTLADTCLVGGVAAPCDCATGACD